MPIDLRSDTVSRPTAAMRQAMATAEVGDDQYGDDPTVNRLQERIAAALKKEAAIFVPSGTMANQIVLRVATRRGDDVIVSRESHAVWHELGGGAANSGVQFTEIGANGVFTAEEFAAAIKPKDHFVFPPTTLVEVENTHNRSGGIVFPRHEAAAICAHARAAGITSFLDGARLFNAAAADGVTVSELAEPFDLVSVALSKGLGCPVGSVLAGSASHMREAARHRRMLGGGMRQAGILAAAGLYALDHHVARLEQDHQNARAFAERLVCDEIAIDLDSVRTNIVIFLLRGPAALCPRIVAACREKGVLIAHFGGTKLRATTHLDVDRDQCMSAAKIVVEVVKDLMRQSRA